MIRMNEEYFNSEKGYVTNNLGEILYYMEFSNTENDIIIRDREGTVTEFRHSGCLDIVDTYFKKDMITEYKDWKYYEEI